MADLPDLVAWLREQLDEDEWVARAATAGPWRALTTGPQGGDHWYVVDHEKSVALIHASDGEDEEQREPDARFIARHDPARVLAEVAAKRALIDDLHAPLVIDVGERACWGCSVSVNGQWHFEPYPCPTVRLLAQPYAGRPGWREEWRTS